MKTFTLTDWRGRNFVRAAGWFLALAVGLALHTSCRREPVTVTKPALDAAMVARVQGQVIGESAYRHKLGERTRRTGTKLSAAEKDAVLDELIDYEAILAQAKAARFEERPEIAGLIRNLIVSRFMEQERGAEPPVTEEETQQYYAAHRADWITPAAVRGAVLFLRAGAKLPPDKRAALKQQAHGLLAEAQETNTDADFTRLVQRHSEHQATRYRGGDAGWMTQSQYEAEFGREAAAAVFALQQPGAFAPLVETADGFYILKLRELKEARLRPLTEVQELIRYRLGRAHQQEQERRFHARMREGLDIEINRSLLESISIQPPEPKPPGLPGTLQAPGIVIR